MKQAIRLLTFVFAIALVLSLVAHGAPEKNPIPKGGTDIDSAMSIKVGNIWA
ncbi:MAG: hypothetical protein IJJ23_05170 [Clostridia bacterium]|nr:hypothetical protein [Clostridia bacterium]